MAIRVPPSVNYQNPMNSVPAIWGGTPPEGARLIPLEIDWGQQGGPNNCVNINLYGGAAATISQIVAISIDNSDCGADVEFIFTDTAQTYTVAAYQPIATFPVFTNGTQVFVSSPGAGPHDTTRFALCNTMPPPVSLPLSAEQEVGVFNDIDVATGLTNLVDPVIVGTVEAITVSFQFVATACNVQWSIEDGETSPKVLAGGRAAASPIANDNAFALSYNLSGLRLKFAGGINFSMNITGSGTNAKASVNIYYRTP